MAYHTYTAHGPYTNGGSPGLDASLFNALEAMLTSGWFDDSISSNHSGIMTSLGQIVNGPINPNVTGQVVNGSVSGTATQYQFLQGTIKAVLVVTNNYRSAAAQSFAALPVAFAAPSMWWTGELQSGKLEAMLSGVSQTFSVQVTMATAGGTQSSNTGINTWSTGVCRSNFDTIKITVTGATAASGVSLLIGT